MCEKEWIKVDKNQLDKIQELAEDIKLLSNDAGAERGVKILNIIESDDFVKSNIEEDNGYTCLNCKHLLEDLIDDPCKSCGGSYSNWEYYKDDSEDKEDNYE